MSGRPTGWLTGFVLAVAVIGGSLSATAVSSQQAESYAMDDVKADSETLSDTDVPLQGMTLWDDSLPEGAEGNAAGQGLCVGDCNGDGAVTVDEVLTLVSIALGNLRVSSCLAGDADNDGNVTIDEILTAVSNGLAGCSQGPPPTPTPTPRPDTVTMNFNVADRCNDSRGLHIRFFDTTNNLVYPNSSQVFVVNSGDSARLSISCQRGANICFGISDDAGVFQYGVGVDGDRGCPDCCYACASVSIQINPGCGSVAFDLTDRCFDGRGIQFRVFDRAHDLVAPPNGQVYVLNADGDSNVASIACIPGALLCYGGEQRPPNNLSWGVGIDGNDGCTGCCLTCPSSGSPVASLQTNLVCN